MENGSNTHGVSKEEFGMGTGSNRQDSIDGSSKRFLLANSHESSITVDFELLWSLRKYLVLLGILAVSMTYNAGLTPPGGFWAKNKGHDAGDPVLRVHFSARYEVFFYCNATAFAASLVLIILLLSKSVTRQKLWLRSMQFTMILDLFSLMGAYAAGSCRALKSSIYIWVLVFAVFIYVGIHILVTIRVLPKWLKEKVHTLPHRILSKWGVHESQRSSHQEKDVEEARKFILLLATFAATVTYQAGLSPPGGFWAENEDNHRPATPILRSNYLHRYNIFVSCNATSFVASLVTIILLLSPELSRHGIRSKAVFVCVVADLLGLIGAYAAGCCRDVATSFYVMFITIIVWICFAVLAGIFVCEPVAHWLEKMKPVTLKCMDGVGRVFSWESGRNRSSDPEQENSHAHEEGSVFEPEQQTSYHQKIPTIKEGESHGAHQPAGKQQTASIEVVSSSEHPSANDQQSANSEDVVCNLEDQSTDYQPDVKESMSNTEHPSMNCQLAISTKDGTDYPEHQSADNNQDANKKEQSSSTDDFKTKNTKDGMSNPERPSADIQQDANMKEQSSSTLDLKTTNAKDGMSNPDHRSADNQQVVSTMEQSSSTVDLNTTDMLVEKVPSDVPARASEIEIVEANNNTRPVENGNIDRNEGAPGKDDNNENADVNSTDEHLKKSRTYLLLLAILAVSLTYQSGLIPPGGFWTRKENQHLAGDRILEDTHHRRYVAFFYLNATAFVASLVMIIMLLNRRMSNKVTKRCALQIAMIVDLLALTGAYVMGSCRETKHSIYISVLVCLVLAYVAVHVLIAIHVIPEGWKKQVAEKLEDFSCKHVWSKLPLFSSNSTAGANDKDWERRRNLLLMLAILTATVTYQAGMNPPGGVWSDDKDVNRKLAGNPILQTNHPKRYDVFYYSNSVSFVSSVVITILLVNKESCEHGIKSYALRVCLVVGLVSLLIAYAAGSCRKATQSIYLIVIATAVLIFLVIQVFLLSSAHDTLGGPFCQFIKRLLGQFIKCLLGQSFWTEEIRTASEPQVVSDLQEKKVRKRHKYLMLLAILAASITYQAGLNPPGGFWSDDGHVAGNPVLRDINPRRYKTFFCFNAISFMASIVVIMLLLSKSVRKKDVPLEVLHLIMILDLLALMTAFAAGSCRKFMTSVYVYALVIGVVIYLVLVIVLSSGIAKCLRTRVRSGLSSRRHPECASRTNTPVPGEQV